MWVHFDILNNKYVNYRYAYVYGASASKSIDVWFMLEKKGVNEDNRIRN